MSHQLSAKMLESSIVAWVHNETKTSLQLDVYKSSLQFQVDRTELIPPQSNKIVTADEEWTSSFYIRILDTKITISETQKVIVLSTNKSDGAIETQSITNKDLSYQVVKITRQLDYTFDHKTTSHYEVLNIPRTADRDVIHQAFLRKARQIHPDKNLNNPHATILMQRLSEAAAVLLDPERKADYDKFLDRQEAVKASMFSYAYLKQLYDDGRLWVLLGGVGLIVGGLLIIGFTSGGALPIILIGGAIGGGVFSAGAAAFSYSISHDATLNGWEFSVLFKKMAIFAVCGLFAGLTGAGATFAIGNVAFSSATAMMAAQGVTEGGIWGLFSSISEGFASGRFKKIWQSGNPYLVLLEVVKGIAIGCLVGGGAGAVAGQISDQLAAFAGEMTGVTQITLKETIDNGLSEMSSLMQSILKALPKVARQAVKQVLETLLGRFVPGIYGPLRLDLPIMAAEAIEAVQQELEDDAAGSQFGFFHLRDASGCVTMKITWEENKALREERSKAGHPSVCVPVSAGKIIVTFTYTNMLGMATEVPMFDREKNEWCTPAQPHKFYFHAIHRDFIRRFLFKPTWTSYLLCQVRDEKDHLLRFGKDAAGDKYLPEVDEQY